ncbi:unnamed protein product, partial [Polarella glacialis]
ACESTDFWLAGVILGLVVYNNMPGLDVRFPPVVFKKVKDEPLGLEDLRNVHPDTYLSLRSLLSWEPENPEISDDEANSIFENTFCLDFLVTFDVNGKKQTRELCEGGKDKAVTYKNREDFVRLYCEWLLTKSVERQFEPFRKGVRREEPMVQVPRAARLSHLDGARTLLSIWIVCHHMAPREPASSLDAMLVRVDVGVEFFMMMSGFLTQHLFGQKEGIGSSAGSLASFYTRRLFRCLLVCDSPLFNALHSAELEMIVCGEQELDFSQLKRNVHYDGFCEDMPYVNAFWQLMLSFDVVQKKRFLSFVTGSDLAPVGGLQELQLVIQRNGGEPTERLPTAHTCFNLLLLPEYGSTSKLERMVNCAMHNAEGFGLE